MPIYMGIFDKPNVLTNETKGEVKASGYEGWIELQNVMLRSNQPIGTSGGGRMSPEQIHEIDAVKFMDSTTTPLFRSQMTGKSKLIIVAFVKDGKAQFKIVMQDAVIKDYKPAVGIEQPEKDTFTINFTAMTYEPSKQSPNMTPSQLYQLGQWAS